MTAPPNNAVKLPFYVAFAVGAAIVVVVDAAKGEWLTAAVGVVVLVLCLAAVRAVRRGDNPWWTRAPLDRRGPRS